MAYSYDNKRFDAKDDGIYYYAELFVHDFSEAATAPVEGTLALIANDAGLGFWTDRPAVVISFQRRPGSQHGFYEIVARELDNSDLGIYYGLKEIPQPDGLQYKTGYYIHEDDQAAQAPIIGTRAYRGNSAALGYWTPEPAVIIGFTEVRIGDYLRYEIEARELDPASSGNLLYFGLIREDDNSTRPSGMGTDGLKYRTQLYMPAADISTLAPVIGTLATWAPSEPNQSVITDIKEVRVGDYVRYEIAARETYRVVLSSGSPAGIYYGLRDDPQPDGLIYRTSLVIPYADIGTSAPIIGTLAGVLNDDDDPWTPTDSVVISMKSARIGNYQLYEIEAREIASATSGIRYNVREEGADGGLRYISGYWIPYSSIGTLAPVIGTLATWTRNPAFVESFQEVRVGSYINYTMVARELDSSSAGIYFNLQREEREDGIHYRTNYYISTSQLATLSPHVGALATWTPTSSYVYQYTSKHVGNYWNFDILARDISQVRVKMGDRGWEFYQTLHLGSSEVMTKLPDIGDAATWIPTEFGMTAQVLDFDVQKIGSYYLGTVHAVGPDYYTGIGA